MSDDVTIRPPAGELRLGRAAEDIRGGEGLVRFGLMDEAHLLRAENRELRAKLEAAQFAARTISTVTAALVALACQRDGYPLDEAFRVERSLINRMTGVRIALSESDDGKNDVIIRLRERAPDGVLILEAL